MVIIVIGTSDRNELIMRTNSVNLRQLRNRPLIWKIISPCLSVCRWVILLLIQFFFLQLFYHVFHSTITTTILRLNPWIKHIELSSADNLRLKRILATTDEGSYKQKSFQLEECPGSVNWISILEKRED